MKEFPPVPAGRPIFVALTFIATIILICAAFEGFVDKKIRESYNAGYAAAMAYRADHIPTQGDNPDGR